MVLQRKHLLVLFYTTLIFALLGPTFGISLTENFRFTFFRLGLLLLSLGVLGHFLMKRKLDGSYLKPVRWYLYFFLFWFLYGILSLTWAGSYSHGVRYLFLLGTMLILTSFFPLLVHREEALKRMMKVLFWTFFAIVLFGVIESVTFIHLPSSRYFGMINASVTSVFQNQNDLGSFITLSLPFLISSLWMTSMSRPKKLFVYSVIVLALYILVATGSRSNTMMALPFSLIVLMIGLPFVVKKEQLTFKNISKGVMAAIAAVIIVAGLSFLFLTDEARQTATVKLGSTFNLFLDIKGGTWDPDEGDDEVLPGGTGESGTVRKYLILNGLKFLHQSHYLGVGAGNIEPMMKDAPKVNKVNMHNWWIEVLVNFGVIVFVLYMVLYVLMLWKCWKLMKIKVLQPRSQLIRWSAYGALASLCGYIFGGIAPSTAVHFTPMWIVYGVTLCIILIGEGSQNKSEVQS